MRDASGNLVEVRVREPWSLHLLTADGTNAVAEEGEIMKAPPEPGLVQLTPTGIELLVENYVRWSVQKKNTCYFGAFPRAFIDGLREFSPSSIPIVRAINTAPLVTMSGYVIYGVGLDRNTGLVHRIDPLLYACVPSEPLSEQGVRDALNFLLDEWLVNVALDRVGKCIAIMLALTIIERALLAERPAFFVTAPQRGGGKTTLVHMIVLAVLGAGRRCQLVQKPRGTQEGPVFLLSSGSGGSCLGQHCARISNKLPSHRGCAHRTRDIRSGAGSFPRGGGGINCSADIYGQLDCTAW